MNQMHLQHQPTLRQLLNSEAMAEAQVVFGDDLLDRPIIQVVGSLSPPPRAGSLVVTRPELLTNNREPLPLEDLAALIIVRQTGMDNAQSIAQSSLTSIKQTSADSSVHPLPSHPPHPSGQSSARGAGSSLVNTPQAAFASATPAGIDDVSMKRILKLCTDAGTPLILMPGFGEPGQVADDVRMAFLREVKQANARLHGVLVSLLLEEGLEGLVEEISTNLNRPVSVETADFKVLASRNMNPTPANQQRAVSEEAQGTLKRLITRQNAKSDDHFVMAPLKIGRRLVLPICFKGSLVGYLSVMVRPNDDLESTGEYMQAAALAAMIEFSQREKDGSVFSVTQKSLLKDLLAGRGLSAADQERLERHYGFDLCDGILVFAVQAAGTSTLGRSGWPEEQFITTEVEGTRVYLLPYLAKEERSWQEVAAALLSRVKDATESGAQLKLQVGAARMVETLLDLTDAYKEARQALIIGTMIHGENEFTVGYGDLGIKRLLYLMIDHPEFERFYEETLAPLEAYDAEWESELLPSLRVYLQEGANLNSAARALFIHRHTLRYRLEQIAEILKVDIDSQDVLLNLQIAFMIGEMKGATQG